MTVADLRVSLPGRPSHARPRLKSSLSPSHVSFVAVTLDDIRKIDRKREPPDDGLMSEMLWSDPQARATRHACFSGGGWVAPKRIFHSLIE